MPGLLALAQMQANMRLMLQAVMRLTMDSCCCSACKHLR